MKMAPHLIVAAIQCSYAAANVGFLALVAIEEDSFASGDHVLPPHTKGVRYYDVLADSLTVQEDCEMEVESFLAPELHLPDVANQVLRERTTSQVLEECVPMGLRLSQGDRLGEQSFASAVQRVVLEIETYSQDLRVPIPETLKQFDSTFRARSFAPPKVVEPLLHRGATP
nr:hypothetical protein [Luteimonas cellulosilyticus]